MLLDNNRDKSIKRYLSSVGKLYCQARTTESRYYLIEYSEDLQIKVRFSNHFKNEQKGYHIDIVKTSESTYFIKTITGISISLYAEDARIYLKSLLLLFPEILKSNNILKECLNKTSNCLNSKIQEIESLNKYIKKEEERFELGDSIWNQNKDLQNEIQDLKNKLTNVSNVKNSIIQKHKNLETKLHKISMERNGLNNKVSTILKNNQDLKTEINILRKYAEKKESFKDKVLRLLKCFK